MLEQYMLLKYLNFKVCIIILTLVFVWFWSVLWKDKKLFYLIKKKNDRLENGVVKYFHILLCFFFFKKRGL